MNPVDVALRFRSRRRLRMEEAERRRRHRFDDLFASYGADVVAYCRWRAGSPSDAQDAVADVFLTAWRRLDDVPDDDGARLWLYATARRVLANQRRSERRRAALSERIEVESAARLGSPTDAEGALVHEALARLSTADREVLLLAEWEGRSPAEIGFLLGCRAVTARGRLHRARRRFRAAFEEVRGGSSPSRDHERRRATRSVQQPVKGGS
jgi:RNA polymerase sigma-70 factor (ECF subfamily)